MTEPLIRHEAAGPQDWAGKLRLAACSSHMVNVDMSAADAFRLAGMIEAASQMDEARQAAEAAMAQGVASRVRAERLTAEAGLSVQRSAMLAVIGLAALLAAITVVLL